MRPTGTRTQAKGDAAIRQAADIRDEHVERVGRSRPQPTDARHFDDGGEGGAGVGMSYRSKNSGRPKMAASMPQIIPMLAQTADRMTINIPLTVAR